MFQLNYGISRRILDKWGQYCYMLLNRKDEIVILVLVLYRVCMPETGNHYTHDTPEK